MANAMGVNRAHLVRVHQVHDLIGDSRYLWHGESNFVQLDPQACPAHLFRVRRKVKTEQDFDYFL